MTIEPVTFAEDGADAPAAAPVRRPRGWRRLAVGVAVAATLGVAALWFGRIPVADHFIASQLAARGVPARYTLNRIGPRTQRLENVVLGDPASPDLSARWVEVDIGYAGFSPAVTAVRVSGLRLRGAWRGGRLTLGVLDRLLGEGTGKAELPDIDLTIIDGRTSIGTDFGQAGLAISGTGRLYGGFSGAAAIAAPRLAASGCILEDMRGHVAVSTASGRLSVKGPLQARQIGCARADAMLLAPDLGLDVRLAKAFDGASGALTLAAPALKMGGGVFARPAGLLTFDGPFAEMAGSHSFSVESAKIAQLRSGPVKLGGRFALRGDPQNSALTSSLMLAAADLAMADERTLSAMAGKLVDTPLAPFARRFGDAVRKAGLGNSLTLRGRLRWTGLGGDAVMERGRLVAESGARIELAAPARLVIDQARSLWEVKGGFRAGGGGLPDIAFDAGRARDGRVSGRLEMEPYAAEGARLALAPMPFTLMPGSGEGALRTILTLDGPLPGGRVKGLTVPLDLRLREDGGFALAGSCTPVRWTSLTLSSAQFDPADLRLCAEQGQPLLAREGAGLRGGVVLGQVLLKGRIGAAPLSVKTSSARLGLAGLRFALNDIAVRLGDSSAPTLFDAARIDGGAEGRGFQGRLGGAHARIGAVPLDLGQIEGGWTFVDGRLALSGALVVSDTAPEPRFFPLLVPDARLALIDGKTGAQGTLRHAGRNRAVATVRIAHDLGAGAGSATFDLGDLAFSSGLQPDDLTPMARGVVADVQARVTGKGRIDWSAAGVTSNGIFSTENARFAAAFGPVEGFSTTLRFEDLLGLRSAPGQTIRVAGINPGIEVRDGVIRYALLSSELARIEGGRWPFAGGELDLLPATLDLDSRKARHLAFRVMGLDAGAFINTLDLKDISATGTFDGLLPMIFDQHGGRIEGGILVARQPGLPPLLVENASTLTVPCDPSKTSGTLSYVGQISNEQLGAMGTLAFEALKNLRYRCLTVLLDGALDGEFVTRIAINGINQGTPAAASSFLTRPFLGLPFLFNVRIEAPFRGLLNTAQSFIDPSNLVRESLGPQYQTVLDAGAGAEPGGEGKPPLAVQPPESDKGVMKERK